MESITDRFKNLPIDGALLEQLYIVPLKKIFVEFMTLPGSVDDKKGGREYDLQFNKILDFELDMSVKPSSKIVSHNVYDESDYLNEHRNSSKKCSRKVDEGKLRHFQLVFERGQLDVIAEEFSCSIIWDTR